MKIQKILETCLCVNHLEKAEEFYKKILGLEVFAKEKDRHVFFRCGNQMFLLFNPQSTNIPHGEIPPHGTSGSGHVAFGVNHNQVSSWRDFLQKHSIEIEREITWPSGGISLYFRDPSGNSVELATPRLWGLEET